MLKKTKELVVNGANRGTWTFSTLWFPQMRVTGQNLPVKVDLYDPVPGRAERVAAYWQRNIVPAVGHQKDALASLEFPTAMRNLFIDDLPVMARVLEIEPNHEVLQFCFLMASGFPAYGGHVIGIAGQIPSNDPDVLAAAKLLVAKSAQLVGGRTTSRRMFTPIQSFQMKPARLVAHAQLVNKAQAYFGGADPVPDLFVTETLNPAPPHLYPARVVETGQRPTKEQAEEKALDLASKATEGQALAVVFVSPTEPGMRVQFLVREKESWQPNQQIAFPVDANIQRLHQAATRPQPELSEVVATD